ncbi:MAG: hypothetical protein ACU0CY_01365 [Maritimibacter harenae]
MTASIHFLRPFHEARLDDIPLIWTLPPDAPTGIVIHVPDFGQRREETAPLLGLFNQEGKIAVSLDLARHGARGDGAGDLREAAQADYARLIWTILGETVLDIPTVSTWARSRFGDLPLSVSGFGLGGDVALAAGRMVSDLADLTVVGASPDWTCPLPEFEELTGAPDTRAMLFRRMLEPMTHAADYAGCPMHFLRIGGSERAAAIDAFKAQVFDLSAEEGGEIVTTTLAAREGVDFADPAIWWPHIGSLAA